MCVTDRGEVTPQLVNIHLAPCERTNVISLIIIIIIISIIIIIIILIIIIISSIIILIIIGYILPLTNMGWEF
jgi:hypothetical protein